ncbi:MAG: pseudouridine synthase [Patescibacteria group bacterium]|jgi:23S rRNA pseudouridine2605 synthase
MRINKYISLSGQASRRKADELIQHGRVRVNNSIVRQLGMEVDPEKDRVFIDGQLCQVKDNFIYLAFHKPRGYVCTHAHYDNEKSIFDLLPEKFRHLKIAGRLDKDSEGLLILSDDGDLIYRLTHPKFEQEKRYEARTSRPLSAETIQKLKNGVELEEGLAKADTLQKSGGNIYTITLHQGWKRQIRRMFGSVNANIVSLTRVSEGNYRLGGLPSGGFKIISRSEVLK